MIVSTGFKYKTKIKVLPYEASKLHRLEGRRDDVSISSVPPWDGSMYSKWCLLNVRLNFITLDLGPTLRLYSSNDK